MRYWNHHIRRSEGVKVTRICSLGRAVLGVALLVAVAVGAVRINAGETPKKIRVIYTNDMNGYWQPCG